MQYAISISIKSDGKLLVAFTFQIHEKIIVNFSQIKYNIFIFLREDE